MNVKTRKFFALSGLYVLVGGACLLLASYEDHHAAQYRAARLAGQSSVYEAEVSAERLAGFCKAGAALGTAAYVLGLGLIFSLPWIRLISGNLLVLFGLLLLIELTTHLLGLQAPAIPRPDAIRAFRLWVYDATKGWFHAPSTKGVSFFGGPDAGQVHINSLGLRGDELQLDRPEVSRVLVLGDSYVFGVGVDEDHLMTTHLERLLQPYFPSGLEVVNMGVSGYSTDQEFLLFKELGRLLRPKIVILVVCDNDYVDNSLNFVLHRYYKPYFDVDDQGGLHLQNVPTPRLSGFQRAKLWLGQESNVWNFVRSRESEKPVVRGFLGLFEVDVPRKPRRPYRATRAIVKSFAREVESLDAWFFVTSTGHRQENPALFRSLSAFLTQEGIHHLDLLPVLERARTEEPERKWDFGHDVHWNLDAHELVARVLSDQLIERHSGTRGW